LEQELQRAIESKSFSTNRVELLRVQKVQVTFDSDKSDSDLVIPIFSTGRNIPIGSLLIPANTFGKGCILTIRSGTPKNGKLKTSSSKDSDGCNSDKSKSEEEVDTKLLSPPLSIETSGKGCGDPSSLRNNLKLELIGKLANEQSCIGFVEEDNDPWRCLGDTSSKTQGRGLAIYRSETSHLT